jgi:hypothetical protein
MQLLGGKMLRTMTAFYLLSLILAFTIAFYLAVRNVPPAEILGLAMVAWPMAALVMLARKKAREVGLA